MKWANVIISVVMFTVALFYFLFPWPKDQTFYHIMGGIWLVSALVNSYAAYLYWKRDKP